MLGFAVLFTLAAFSTTSMLVAGENNCTTEKPAKCGEGKCGSDKPASKCGEGKCGGK
ncbi:MAG: FIG024746: hypothetical protein [uncultured Sulfurovum sp.]|uniref:Periplasmic protein n=1 Tax=uncultured Sulfurovum sp. TaxID=269237 RepID=A0A6S6TSM3_9BACT|nr:MAG: FIG024746: hypothetical protein [uncultured Sulfurovum sp.]CAA6821147.1 MAG: FIG024746: hypothetical protein [uncultured Sulfurovum sp.]